MLNIFGTGIRTFASSFVIVALIAGCGGPSGPEIGTVHGVVKLDGAPLPDAEVVFVPESGRPASGLTNAQGEYELTYSQSAKGAAVGKYTVKITTGREAVLAEGVQTQAKVAEKLPAKYHEKTELIAEVGSGTNQKDFDLKSK